MGANVVAETCWIRNIVLELKCRITIALLSTEIISVRFLSSKNTVKHQRTKHVEIDIHFVHEKVNMGQV